MCWIISTDVKWKHNLSHIAPFSLFKDPLGKRPVSYDKLASLAKEHWTLVMYHNLYSTNAVVGLNPLSSKYHTCCVILTVKWQNNAHLSFLSSPKWLRGYENLGRAGFSVCIQKAVLTTELCYRDTPNIPAKPDFSSFQKSLILSLEQTVIEMWSSVI